MFYAHAAIQHSNLQDAETRISDQGFILGGYEMESAHIRCIYDWYDGVNPDECLSAIFEASPNPTRDAWTKVLLYVEEVFWQFDTSRRYSELYGAAYSDDIEYWRADVERDPTGIFAFSIVSEAGDLIPANPDRTPEQIAGCMLTNYGVQDLGRNLCRGYRNVRDIAPQGFISAPQQHWCSPGMIIQPSRSPCDLNE